MPDTQKNLTRLGLADAVFHRLGVTHAEANHLVDELFNEVTAGLVGGAQVKITNFGTFVSSLKGARMGRNPKTGVEVKIEPHYAVRFKPSKELREKVDVALKNSKGMPS